MVRRKASSDLAGPRSRSNTERGQRMSLENLRKQFVEFRRKHRSRTRIPTSLRTEALEAVRKGAGWTEVCRACGVSSSQLDTWQRRLGASSPDVSASIERDEAQVFSVETDTAIPNEGNAEQRLEFRLNGWSISLRRVAGGTE